jgi:type I restriction enzyme S subunit
MKLVVPPLAEQRKIAEILGAWDEAIEKQSRLIEKLELRKRGLMQRLLIGRTRLPGFTTPWQKVKLGEICKRVTRRNEENNQNVMTISAQKGFVSQTDFFNKSVASSTLDNYYLVLKDEFCYNKSYSNGYPMGAIKRLKEADKAVVTTLYICFSIADSKRLDINFFEQFCESGGLNRGLMKVANEGGRAHGLLNVTPTDFFSLVMLLPTLPEQKAIAEVLTAADNEIIIHRKKLDALRLQKRGLMQQLLTGKTRVKI